MTCRGMPPCLRARRDVWRCRQALNGSGRLSVADVDRVAAVDGELGAVDVGRAIGRKEGNDVRNLTHRPPATRENAPIAADLIEEAGLGHLPLLSGALSPPL